MRNEEEDKTLGGLRDGPGDQRHANLAREMTYELHELCQPLTALQCRLELARMMGDASLLLETVEDSLTETRRMFATVARMRERLTSGEAQEWAEERDARFLGNGG